jgi:hypothetical protein
VNKKCLVAFHVKALEINCQWQTMIPLKVVNDMGQVCQINANSMAKIADQSNSLKKIKRECSTYNLFCDLYDGE